MDAREAVEEFLRIPQKFLGEYAAANALIAHLATHGFDITHRDENHGPTRDRAATVARNTFVGDSLAPTFRISEAIRAMEVKNA